VQYNSIIGVDYSVFDNKEFDYNFNLVFGCHFMEKSKMTAKYTRKLHNLLPKFNFQLTFSLLLSTYDTSVSLLASVYNQLL